MTGASDKSCPQCMIVESYLTIVVRFVHERVAGLVGTLCTTLVANLNPRTMVRSEVYGSLE